MSEFKPFQKVLVRDEEDDAWEPKKGEIVAVKDHTDGCWDIRMFRRMLGRTFVDHNEDYWEMCEPLKKHFSEAFIPEEK